MRKYNTNREFVKTFKFNNKQYRLRSIFDNGNLFDFDKTCRSLFDFDSGISSSELDEFEDNLDYAEYA